VALGCLVIAGGLSAVFSGRHRDAKRHQPVRPSSPPTSTSSRPSSWRPVAPATTVPAETPVQQRYDAGFETGFSSAANKAMMTRAESFRLPSPAVGGGWPVLPLSGTPEGWTEVFLKGLLDIHFAHQSRIALAAWLVAEEAPDLMPGIPPAFQDRALTVTLLDPGITGQLSPLPPANQWLVYAKAGVRWWTSDLEVQLEPQWQQMIDAGWQPPDMRAAVEVVTGTLTVAEGTTKTKRRFSVVVQIGSARWRHGYGTVLVSDWKES